jgi:hypothetical protein
MTWASLEITTTVAELNLHNPPLNLVDLVVRVIRQILDQ